MASPGGPSSEGVSQDPTLDDVLLALQKSFSRVSAATSRADVEGGDQPRSIITGPIDFDMTVTGDVVYGEDRLRIHQPGAITLRIHGSIRHDVTIEATESSEGAQSNVGPSPKAPGQAPAATGVTHDAMSIAEALRQAADLLSVREE
jgi:hypothetical protein